MNTQQAKDIKVNMLGYVWKDLDYITYTSYTTIPKVAIEMSQCFLHLYDPLKEESFYVTLRTMTVNKEILSNDSTIYLSIHSTQPTIKIYGLLALNCFSTEYTLCTEYDIVTKFI